MYNAICSAFATIACLPVEVLEVVTLKPYQCDPKRAHARLFSVSRKRYRSAPPFAHKECKHSLSHSLRRTLGLRQRAAAREFGSLPRSKKNTEQMLGIFLGGEGEIRTLGSCNTTTVFKTVTINHSVTSPSMSICLAEEGRFELPLQVTPH